MRLLSLASKILFLSLTVLFATSAFAEESKVFFKSPADNAEVKNPFTIEMGVEGMTVAPAGVVVAKQGHHHIIIDGKPIPEGEVIVSDPSHIHFGKGQTTHKMILIPGKHTLTLQFGDGAHRSYGPAMSQTISILVKN